MMLEVYKLKSFKLTAHSYKIPEEIAIMATKMRNLPTAVQCRACRVPPSAEVPLPTARRPVRPAAPAWQCSTAAAAPACRRPRLVCGALRCRRPSSSCRALPLGSACRRPRRRKKWGRVPGLLASTAPDAWSCEVMAFFLFFYFSKSFFTKIYFRFHNL